MPPGERICVQCGASFAPRHVARLTCSEACRREKERDRQRESKRLHAAAGVEARRVRRARARASVEPPPDSRPIPGLPDGYRADEAGAIWRRCPRSWRRMHIYVGDGGFRYIYLKKEPGQKRHGVARCVLRAFVGPRPLGCEAFHFPDRDPANNRPDNLRWAPIGTGAADNPGDVSRFGAAANTGVGSANRSARLDESTVAYIRLLYRADFSAPELAERFGVSVSTILEALRGITWGHVPDPLADEEIRPPGGGPESRLARFDDD